MSCRILPDIFKLSISNVYLGISSSTLHKRNTIRIFPQCNWIVLLSTSLLSHHNLTVVFKIESPRLLTQARAMGFSHVQFSVNIHQWVELMSCWAVRQNTSVWVIFFSYDNSEKIWSSLESRLVKWRPVSAQGCGLMGIQLRSSVLVEIPPDSVPGVSRWQSINVYWSQRVSGMLF